MGQFNLPSSGAGQQHTRPYGIGLGSADAIAASTGTAQPASQEQPQHDDSEDLFGMSVTSCLCACPTLFQCYHTHQCPYASVHFDADSGGCQPMLYHRHCAPSGRYCSRMRHRYTVLVQSLVFGNGLTKNKRKSLRPSVCLAGLR